MNQLLYTIKEVFTSYLINENEKTHYFIPFYQRGYKWERKHIIKLLDDINAFKPEGSKFYCLQNITIVPAEDCFNVVDGQQRLTTLTILLSYLGEKELVKDKVLFPNNSIRKETNDFIRSFITNGNEEMLKKTWEIFIEEFSHFDHQDIYHIYTAYHTIEDWFSKKTSPSEDDFVKKLLNNVKLIINKVDGNNSEEKIFGNLNSKRVPLDGADLVRAILITRVAHEEGKREADIKNIVRVNERRVKIGWEIDQINNWWSKENVRNYFSKFIQVKSEEIGGKKLFREDKYPINLLLLLFAEKNRKKQLTLEFIESHNNNALSLYKELIKLNSTLQDWFEDREIYHYLGFLFNNTSKKDINFSDVWEMWTDSETRSDFKKALKGEIKEQILDKEKGTFLPLSTDKNIDWYNDKYNNAKLIKVLILLDVIHATKAHQNFMPFNAFTKDKNDIEHIFPQNPENITEKKSYIEFLNTYVLIENEKFDVSQYDKQKDEPFYLTTVDTFIDKRINAIPINSIGNLVLLYYRLNRSIGRISYAKKRARIIQHFNMGNFIQPHTFKVFARYFVNDILESKELEHWTEKDIEANARQIEQDINQFFNIKL